MKPSELWPNGVKPNIGDFATSKSIGRQGRAIHIWEACPQCHHERWVKYNARGLRCKDCSPPPVHFGSTNSRWNQSKKTITKSGIRVYLTSGNPYFAMAHKCSKDFAVLEHRLVMAIHIGRLLKPWEVVHHIDGNNLNNAIENLELLPNQTQHTAYTLLQVELRRLEARVTLLEAENTLLKIQIGSMGYGNPELSEGSNDL
jgi:hypothetical protein